MLANNEREESLDGWRPLILLWSTSIMFLSYGSRPQIKRHYVLKQELLTNGSAHWVKTTSENLISNYAVVAITKLPEWMKNLEEHWGNRIFHQSHAGIYRRCNLNIRSRKILKNNTESSGKDVDSFSYVKIKKEYCPIQNRKEVKPVFVVQTKKNNCLHWYPLPKICYFSVPIWSQ